MTLKHIETNEDYKKYQKRVSDFLESEKIFSVSRIDSESENYFSWNYCDCCNRSLGGDRIDVNAYCEETKEINEYSICIDCEYYIAYGQLDDMTMMDLKD